MQKLCWITVIFVYLLMVAGNTVSATGSGLACPDWPLCYGQWIPPMRADVLIEWSHRLLAALTSVLILATLYFSWKKTSAQGKHSGPIRVLVILLVCQILLGGITVLLELSVAASTLHLTIATLVFSGMIAIAAMHTWSEKRLISEKNPKARRLAIAGCVGLLVQLIVGGLVRHSHAGLACPNFPACHSAFLPIPFTEGTFLAFFHRWWGVGMLGLFVHLVLALRRSSFPTRLLSSLLLGVALLQVVFGIATVLGGLPTGIRATHAAIGYLLWGMLFFLALRLGAFRFLWPTPKKKRSSVSRSQTVGAAG